MTDWAKVFQDSYSRVLGYCQRRWPTINEDHVTEAWVRCWQREADVANPVGYWIAAARQRLAVEARRTNRFAELSPELLGPTARRGEDVYLIESPVVLVPHEDVTSCPMCGHSFDSRPNDHHVGDGRIVRRPPARTKKFCSRSCAGRYSRSLRKKAA